MRYEDIKTYNERCKNFEGIVTNQIVVDRLLEEIDELREYIEAKQWQSLEDEKIEDCWDGPLSKYHLRIIREIEAKIKEKNT